MKKSPHVIWVCPSSRPFFRSKGEVKSRPGSVIPKLAEQGIKIDVLIPHDPTLLPKTKLSPARTTHHTIKLSQNYNVDIIKLTRGGVSPGIYMAALPSTEPAIASALFSKAAIALAEQLKRPVDIFHVFDWEGALLPLFLELEKNGSRIFKNTRTFLNLTSLREGGSFAPTVLAYLGIPESLFHPEGVEFYGRVSFLKAGLLFSDGVGLVESALTPRSFVHRNGHGFEGVLDSMSHKLRRWASERSLKSHLDAYEELLSITGTRPVLPIVMKKVHTEQKQVDEFIDSWGPPPPDRYHVNSLSFLVQSPTKAFAFWEWTHLDYVDYAIALEDRTAQKRTVLSRGQQAFGDYWIDVEPGREYVVELVGVRSDGSMHPLLRSRPVKTPRNAPSPNTQAVFIDVKDQRRYLKQGAGVHAERSTRGGTSAFEWSRVELPSSYTEAVSSK